MRQANETASPLNCLKFHNNLGHGADSKGQKLGPSLWEKSHAKGALLCTPSVPK